MGRSKWTTPDFIHAFMEGGLGRKRVHGSYRVLDGEHCKLLVRAMTEGGRPGGSILMAINLSDETTKLSFWQTNYDRCFTYRMAKAINTGSYQKLPDIIISGEEDSLINSGIIATDATHLLIEIGDKPFLLHRDIKDGDAQTVTLGTTRSGCPAFAYANQVTSRVATISEALELSKDPVDERNLVSVWWAKKMEFGFTPPPFNPEDIKTLAAPLNPLDFGFEIEECKLGSISSGKQNLHVFTPKDSILKDTPPSNRVTQWTDACEKWNLAGERLYTRLPNQYKGISIASSRYMYSSSETTIGDIVVTSEGVFIKGTIHNSESWDKKDKLTTWYKLTIPSNQINIAKACSY